MSKANERQVAGDHYQVEQGKEQHWDRVWRLGLDYFQGQITKYVERWKLKNGVEDLKKARHFLDKYIELHTPAEESNIDLTSAESMASSLEKSGRTIIHVGAKGGVNSERQTAVNVAGEPLQWELVSMIGGGHALVPRVDTYRWGEVQPTGWTQFVFEGARQEGFLFTCRTCNGKFHVPPDRNPHGYHECRALADDAGSVHDATEPTRAYVDQG